MKTTAFALAFTWTLFLTAFKLSECPPKFEIGQRWPAVLKACPDIERQAFDRKGDLVSYFCPSQSVAVMGDVTTGQMVGFVKVDFDPRTK